jgi:putative endonuclease
MRWPWARAKKGPPHQETGRLGERAAERYLKKRGCRILARNVTFPQGEVDLVAFEKASRTLLFVEVRSRSVAAGAEPAVTPAETVTPAKRRRIIRAARRYMKRCGASAEDRPVRFDVVGVVFEGDDRKHPRINHLPAAFDSTGR